MPWPDEPCSTCPRLAKGLSLPCRAQTSKHRRFCELANPEHPDFKAPYRRLLADEPEPDPPAPPPVALSMPSLVKQAANFATAVVKHVATGAKVTTNVEREGRLAICRSNACGKYREGDRCGECGCHVEVKASWADQRCPLNPPMWNAIVRQSPGELTPADPERSS